LRFVLIALFILTSVSASAYDAESREIFELEAARRLLHRLEVKVRVNPILRDRVEQVREDVAAREARMGLTTAQRLGPREVDGFALRAFNGTNQAIYRGYGIYQSPRKWQRKRDRYFGVVDAIYEDGTIVVREPNGRVTPFGNIGAAMFDMDEASEFQFRPLTTRPSRRSHF
jgi:hypothetical protein